MHALLAVPRQLLEEVGSDSSDPFLLSDYMHGNQGWGEAMAKVVQHHVLGEPPLLWPLCIHGGHHWQKPCGFIPASLSCG